MLSFLRVGVVWTLGKIWLRHKPCNQKKGDRTPDEAGMALNKPPKRLIDCIIFQRFVKDQPKGLAALFIHGTIWC